MKRMIILSIITLGVLATPVLASLTTKIKVTDGPGNGPGGAFWAEVTQGTISYDSVVIPTGTSFLTFCIENDESVTLGKEYWVEIQTYADAGGSGGGSPDPLDPITSALYTKWLSTEDTTDAAMATKYQLAMYYQEQEAMYGNDNKWYEGTGTTLLDSAYQTYTLTNITNLIATVGSPSSIGMVRVMTLWGDADKNLFAQDLLVVPTPAAVLLGILGLGVAGWKLRKYA
jgi:hypothetical protein